MMGMATRVDPDAKLTEWQWRAKASGLCMYKGKRPDQLTDEECKEMFQMLGARGRYYIFR